MCGYEERHRVSYIQLNEQNLKVKSQNDTITMLQRCLALEAENLKHLLQMEINTHKDIWHDLDLARSIARGTTAWSFW